MTLNEIVDVWRIPSGLGYFLSKMVWSKDVYLQNLLVNPRISFSGDKTFWTEISIVHAIRHQDSIFCPAKLAESSKRCPRPAISHTLAPSANWKPVLSTGLRPQGNQEVKLCSNSESGAEASQSSKRPTEAFEKSVCDYLAKENVTYGYIHATTLCCNTSKKWLSLPGL